MQIIFNNDIYNNTLQQKQQQEFNSKGASYTIYVGANLGG